MNSINPALLALDLTGIAAVLAAASFGARWAGLARVLRRTRAVLAGETRECPRCGYDLRGATPREGVTLACTECGFVIGVDSGRSPPPCSG